MQNASSWCGGNAWCAAPIAVGAAIAGGVSSLLATADLSLWTARATGIIGLAGLVGGAVVGGLIYAITKYDQVAIERRKKYDIANKELLSEQLEELKAVSAEAAAKAEERAKEGLANQERMREHLHDLKNEAQVAKGENYELRHELGTLRGQFMAVSQQLHATDLLLHTAREEMHQTNLKFNATLAKLEASEKKRVELDRELATLRAGHLANMDRLDRLEGAGSGEVLPAAVVPQAHG